MVYGDKSLSFFLGLLSNPHNYFLYKYCRQPSVLLRTTLFVFFHFLSCLLSYLSNPQLICRPVTVVVSTWLFSFVPSLSLKYLLEILSHLLAYSTERHVSLRPGSLTSTETFLQTEFWAAPRIFCILILCFLFVSRTHKLSQWLVDLERQEKGSRWSKNQLSVVWLFFFWRENSEGR